MPSSKPHVALRSPTGKSFFHLRLSRRFFKIAGTVLAATAAVALLGYFWVDAQNKSGRGGIGQEFELAAGPWGKIKARPVLIKAPAEVFDPDFQLGDGLWHFESASPHAIAGILRDCGLSENQISALLATLRQVPGEPNLSTLQPPAEIVMALEPETRSRLYSRLARLDANFAQCQPFRMGSDHLEDWLGRSGVDPDTRDLVRKLLWRSGDTLMFSDYNLVAARIPDPAKRVDFQRLLAEKVALFATMEIPAGADVDGLVQYWGAEGRTEAVRSIIESAAASGGASIGITEILPPFARQKLNRFPDPELLKNSPPACHWSTFNFFRRGKPDDAFHTAAGVEKEIREHYDPLKGSPRFGDIVLLNEPDGSSIHSAVFIADDIVFTKNGPSAATPWVLSTIEEMTAFYPVGKALTPVFYRHKTGVACDQGGALN